MTPRTRLVIQVLCCTVLLSVFSCAREERNRRSGATAQSINAIQNTADVDPLDDGLSLVLMAEQIDMMKSVLPDTFDISLYRVLKEFMHRWYFKTVHDDTESTFLDSFGWFAGSTIELFQKSPECINPKSLMEWTAKTKQPAYIVCMSPSPSLPSGCKISPFCRDGDPVCLVGCAVEGVEPFPGAVSSSTGLSLGLEENRWLVGKFRLPPGGGGGDGGGGGGIDISKLCVGNWRFGIVPPQLGCNRNGSSSSGGIGPQSVASNCSQGGGGSSIDGGGVPLYAQNGPWRVVVGLQLDGEKMLRRPGGVASSGCTQVSTKRGETTSSPHVDPFTKEAKTTQVDKNGRIVSSDTGGKVERDTSHNSDAGDTADDIIPSDMPQENQEVPGNQSDKNNSTGINNTQPNTNIGNANNPGNTGNGTHSSQPVPTNTPTNVPTATPTSIPTGTPTPEPIRTLLPNSAEIAIPLGGVGGPTGFTGAIPTPPLGYSGPTGYTGPTGALPTN